MADAPREAVAVAVAIVLQGGRVLLTRRPPGAHLEGLWEFPGGKIQPGESPTDCAERETLEETGLHVAAGAVIEVREHVYPERRVLIHFVECQPTGGTLNANLYDACWLPLEKLSSLTLPAANAGIVRLLLERDRGPDVESSSD